MIFSLCMIIDQSLISSDRPSPVLSLPPPPPTPLGLTAAIREQFVQEFSEWYEPGTAKRKGHSRRKSSTRSLHQKLVVSKNNAKKATKIDMDDRAKMLQYFSKANDDTKTISIHDLFHSSWRLPMSGPRVPTVVTVQAPAGQCLSIYCDQSNLPGFYPYSLLGSQF